MTQKRDYKVGGYFLVVLFFCTLSIYKGQTEAFSLSFTSKMLENGKYVTAKGDVFFKKQGAILTTHLISPFENITILNANGDMKIYDVTENTLIQSSSDLTSSESSYFWHFVNGNYNDLGIKKNGYVIQSTKTEDGMLVTNWVPKAGSMTELSKIILVHEKSLPIYLEFIGSKNKALGKIFFSAYQKVGEVQIPFKITEIGYKEKGDSVITDKAYSNPKINEAVDKHFLDFKIPANVKLAGSK